MITDYKILKLNGEETLLLNIDFSFEFAKLSSNKKKKKIKDIIEDFIKEKNIKFKGKNIAIISGGILIATLTLKAPITKYNENTTLQESYPNSVIVLENNDNELSKLVDERIQMSKNNTSEEEIPTISKALKEDKPSIITNKTPDTKSTTTKKSEAQPIVEETKHIQEQTPKQETYLTINRANGTVLNLELEEYIVGVVGAEMPASFHTEALKAQAIIARTYALKSIEKGTPLTDNSSTQNYKTNDELKAMWGSSYNTYFNKIKNAVDSTKGIYLTYQGQTIEAVYHSTSNGTTEDAKNVWNNFFPYLIPVSSPYDNQNSSYTKSTSLSYDAISTKLGISLTMDSNIRILSKTAGNRVLNISFDDLIYTGVFIRNILGLRSADFDIEKTENGIIFTTRGFGHGVGLSQYGSNGLAKNGANYETILKHYYTGVDLSYYE